MNHTVSEATKILGVDVLQVKHWSSLFNVYLTTSASLLKGKPHSFSDADLLVLCYIGNEWEDDPDIEAIKIGLNLGNHHEEVFVERLYYRTG